MLPYVFVLVVIILADHSTTSAGHELEKRCEFYSRTWQGRCRWTPHCKNKCHNKKEDAWGGHKYDFILNICQLGLAQLVQGLRVVCVCLGGSGIQTLVVCVCAIFL
ncbi:Gamma-thionin [Trema orientale]|uniref:Gamma-thionin n=1 Tax=Trema orientale TaxID=63057 RepID=A0A2P5DJN2_TREOI|nr:Gamma-thionin [Trema orientale]